jgi:hypothetical protein
MRKHEFNIWMALLCLWVLAGLVGVLWVIVALGLELAKFAMSGWVQIFALVF